MRAHVTWWKLYRPKFVHLRDSMEKINTILLRETSEYDKYFFRWFLSLKSAKIEETKHEQNEKAGGICHQSEGRCLILQPARDNNNDTRGIDVHLERRMLISHSTMLPALRNLLKKYDV